MGFTAQNIPCYIFLGGSDSNLRIDDVNLDGDLFSLRCNIT